MIKPKNQPISKELEAEVLEQWLRTMAASTAAFKVEIAARQPKKRMKKKVEPRPASV